MNIVRVVVECRVKVREGHVQKRPEPNSPLRYKNNWQYPEGSWQAKQADLKKKKDRLEMMLEMKRLKELW